MGLISTTHEIEKRRLASFPYPQSNSSSEMSICYEYKNETVKNNLRKYYKTLFYLNPKWLHPRLNTPEDTKTVVHISVEIFSDFCFYDSETINSS